MELINQFEIAITLFIQGLGNWLQLPMQAFTFLGNEFFFLLVMPALYWSMDPKIGFRSGMMLILSVGFNSILKVLFHTPRPYWMDARVEAMSSETSFGLPSGHSQNAASIWGIIAASIKKQWFTIAAIVIIFLIGLSRIYLGVHYLHDVISGWLVGALLVIIYLKLEKPVADWLKRKSLAFQLLIIFVFSITLIFSGWLTTIAVENWNIPGEWEKNAILAGAEIPDPLNLEGIIAIAGVGLGFPTGYAWWKAKFGAYLINCSGLKRVIRYLVGLLGIAVLYFGLKYILPEEPGFLAAVFRYIRYALIGFWVTAIAPLVFKSMHLDK